MEHLLVSVLVIERQIFQAERNSLGLRDQLQRIGKNGQRGEAKKIHLQQAHLFDGNHVERGDNFVVLGAMQRHQFRKWAWRDHDPSGVNA